LLTAFQLVIRVA